MTLPCEGGQDARAHSSVRDDVHEAAGDHDDLADRLAVGVLPDVLVLLGGGLDGRLVGVGGDHDLGADLAVDLHDEFDLVLDEVLLIELRPGLLGKECVVAEAGVDFLGEVRGEGVEDLQEGDEEIGPPTLRYSRFA